MITDPVFYFAAIPAVIIFGMAKGGFAGALGMLGVPMIALVVPPVQAAAILLPILIAMDIFAVWAYRHSWHGGNLKVLLPAACVGIGIGWATAEFVSSDHVRLIVGLISLLFTLDYWLGRSAAAARVPSRSSGSLWGTVAGFTSFVSHAGGPPLQMYLLPQRMTPKLFAGTSAIFFACVNAIKLVPYAALGQFDTTNLMTSLVLAPLAPISIYVGVKLVEIVRVDLFYRLAHIFIFVVAWKLIWDGASAILGWQ